MNIWIQYADSSTLDVKANTADEAIKAFKDFDWKKEREKQKKIGPDDSIDPGFGCGVWGEERFIHIIPKDNNNVEVLYVKTKAALNEQFMGENLTHEQAEEIIRAYFTSDEDTIMKYCN